MAIFKKGNPSVLAIRHGNRSATQLASWNGFLTGRQGGVVFMLYRRCIQRLLL